MNIPDIGIVFNDEFPDILIDKLTQDIKSEKLHLEIKKFHSSPTASALDWALPTMIAVSILKPYFESFLQELGKDHYQILKSWLKNLSLDSRKVKVFTFKASKSTQKGISNDPQSKVFSISLITKDDRILKVLFDLDLDDTQWNNAIDKILDLLLDNYKNYPNDELTKQLSELSNDKNSEIFVLINRETGNLIFRDIKSVILLNRESQKRP